MNDNSITDLEIYKQQSEQFRQMSREIYTFPAVLSTILGGLFYFAASYHNESSTVTILVLGFAALVSLSSSVIVMRFRKAYNLYINSINAFEREHAITLAGSKGPSTLRIITWLFGFIGLATVGVIAVILCKA